MEVPPQHRLTQARVRGKRETMVVHAEPETIETVTTEALRAQLSAKVTLYETRYGIASADLRDALDTGRLSETMDVCGWLIAWEAMDALGRGGGPTRLE
jgi:hypothetical protein